MQHRAAATILGVCLLVVPAWGQQPGEVPTPSTPADAPTAHGSLPTVIQATAPEIRTPATEQAMSEFVLRQAETWVSPSQMSSSVQVFLTMAVLGLIPALLLMTTSYVRVVVVLGLLRQAFGAQQILPAQVTTAIAMFITMLVMWPTWQKVYDDAIEPYVNEQVEMNLPMAWQAGIQPIRGFMIQQISSRQNVNDIWLFLRYVPDLETEPENYEDVPLRALVPAFMLSELKTAFLIGFRILLPFLVIDLIVAAVTTSMGMFMLPPAMISMPLKLLLFVIVDGWHLVVEMLLQSFQTFN
jgi:flagellar biosynthetic protein FliP